MRDRQIATQQDLINDLKRVEVTVTKTVSSKVYHHMHSPFAHFTAVCCLSIRCHRKWNTVLLLCSGNEICKNHTNGLREFIGLDSVTHYWKQPMIKKISKFYVACNWNDLQNLQYIKYLSTLHVRWNIKSKWWLDGNVKFIWCLQLPLFQFRITGKEAQAYPRSQTTKGKVWPEQAASPHGVLVFW